MHHKDHELEVKVLMGMVPTDFQWVHPIIWYSHSQRTKRELILTILKGLGELPLPIKGQLV